MLHLIKRIVAHRDAINVLAMVDLKTTVATTRLGWLWWLVDPLVMMWIYYFMVKIVFNRGGEDYHLFALTGIVSWQFFAKTMQLTSTTLHRNRKLLTHTRLPLEIFTIVPAIIQSFFALIGYVIIVAWHGEGISLNILSVFPIMLVVVAFALAVGGVLAVWVVYLPDVSKFLDYGLRVGFFITPILYPASKIAEVQSVPQVVKTLLSLNPMMWAIEQIRGIILYGKGFDVGSSLVWLVAGLIAVQAAMLVIRMNQHNIMKHMQDG